MSHQTRNGKAFEYALLSTLYERLKSITNVSVMENKYYTTAKSYFKSLNERQKYTFKITANTSINFLIELEPRLIKSISQKDILVLEILGNQASQRGDVRDILISRPFQRWQIGLSAKNNHRAVKHSRLSQKIDFGKKWLGVCCSDNYFQEIKPIFDMLTHFKENNQFNKWSSIPNKNQAIYSPILTAFRKELLRLYEKKPKIVARNLVQDLIGNKDFYKIIKGNQKIEIQAYNLYGSLNLPFEKIKSIIKTPKLKLPTRVIEIYYKENSTTTLIICLNEGWQISFRLHNASSSIESSLKFDINLFSTPYTLFTHHLFVNE